MGTGLGKQWLWRPTNTGEVALPPAFQEWIMQPEFDHWLRVFFGFTFAFSSWDTLRESAKAHHQELVSSLQQQLDRSLTERTVSIERANFEVMHASKSRPSREAAEPEVRTAPVRGAGGTRLSSLSSWIPNMESRMSYTMDHHGSIVSTSTVNFDRYRYRAGEPRLPSMQQLGFQEQLDAHREADRAAGRITYAFRLALRYSVTQYPDPVEAYQVEESWDAELAVMVIEVVPFVVYIVQVFVVEPEGGLPGNDTDGVSVELMSLSGDVLANVPCNLRIDTVQVLLSALEHIEKPASRLRFVFPDASIVQGDQAGQTLLRDKLAPSAPGARETVQ